MFEKEETDRAEMSLPRIRSASMGVEVTESNFSIPRRERHTHNRFPSNDVNYTSSPAFGRSNFSRNRSRKSSPKKRSRKQEKKRGVRRNNFFPDLIEGGDMSTGYRLSTVQPQIEIQVLKSIIIREGYVAEVAKSATQVTRGDLEALEENRSGLVGLVFRLRDASLSTIEEVLRWRMQVGQREAFLWRGINYLIKMQTDMDFLAVVGPLLDHLGVESFVLVRNPLLMAQSLNEWVVSKEDARTLVPPHSATTDREMYQVSPERLNRAATILLKEAGDYHDLAPLSKTYTAGERRQNSSKKKRLRGKRQQLPKSSSRIRGGRKKQLKTSSLVVNLDQSGIFSELSADSKSTRIPPLSPLVKPTKGMLPRASGLSPPINLFDESAVEKLQKRRRRLQHAVVCEELTEMIRSKVSPPTLVVLVAATVQILLSPEDTIPDDLSWPALCNMMEPVDKLLEKMKDYNTVTIPAFKFRAIKSYVQAPQFTPNTIREICPPAAALCAWVLAVTTSRPEYKIWMEEDEFSTNMDVKAGSDDFALFNSLDEAIAHETALHRRESDSTAPKSRKAIVSEVANDFATGVIRMTIRRLLRERHRDSAATKVQAQGRSRASVLRTKRRSKRKEGEPAGSKRKEGEPKRKEGEPKSQKRRRKVKKREIGTKRRNIKAKDAQTDKGGNRETERGGHRVPLRETISEAEVEKKKKAVWSGMGKIETEYVSIKVYTSGDMAYEFKVFPRSRGNFLSLHLTSREVLQVLSGHNRLNLARNQVELIKFLVSKLGWTEDDTARSLHVKRKDVVSLDDDGAHAQVIIGKHGARLPKVGYAIVTFAMDSIAQLIIISACVRTTGATMDCTIPLKIAERVVTASPSSLAELVCALLPYLLISEEGNLCIEGADELIGAAEAEAREMASMGLDLDGRNFVAKAIRDSSRWLQLTLYDPLTMETFCGELSPVELSKHGFEDESTESILERILTEIEVDSENYTVVYKPAKETLGGSGKRLCRRIRRLEGQRRLVTVTKAADLWTITAMELKEHDIIRLSVEHSHVVKILHSSSADHELTPVEIAEMIIERLNLRRGYMSIDE